MRMRAHDLGDPLPMPPVREGRMTKGRTYTVSFCDPHATDRQTATFEDVPSRGTLADQAVRIIRERGKPGLRYSYSILDPDGEEGPNLIVAGHHDPQLENPVPGRYKITYTVPNLVVSMEIHFEADGAEPLGAQAVGLLRSVAAPGATVNYSVWHMIGDEGSEGASQSFVCSGIETIRMPAKQQTKQTRVYEVTYRDILFDRRFTVTLDGVDRYDKPELEKRIEKHILGEIDYPYTVPYTCWFTHDGPELSKPLVYFTGEVEQVGPTKSSIWPDPERSGKDFAGRLIARELPDKWWEGFMETVADHDCEGMRSDAE